MTSVESGEVRDRAIEWLEQGKFQLNVVLGVLQGYGRLQQAALAAEQENQRLRGVVYEMERLRNRVDVVERECEQLRLEASRLRAEAERYRSEREEIADSLSKAMNALVSRLKPGRPAPPGFRILLIEDEAGIREIMAEMLAAQGHLVLQAAGGREGLARLEAGEAVDLVLTDLRMPGMNGWEVVRAVRDRWSHVRVGIVTGTPELLMEQREPVDLVLTKPVSVQALQEAISRVLS